MCYRIAFIILKGTSVKDVWMDTMVIRGQGQWTHANRVHVRWSTEKGPFHFALLIAKEDLYVRVALKATKEKHASCKLRI